jgi:tRNA-Thr(GGU) m(6)t(6)A37 methyltransferase TsaA
LQEFIFMNSTFIFNPIGIIHSCFPEKFGIPRQPGLVPTAQATLEILPPFDQDEAFSGLEAFSHLWLVFVFHGIRNGSWHPTVRPPRLGGNRRTGVFATRSGFRPNAIGMSAVSLKKICRIGGQLELHLSGIDLLDRTPVLDIKPYLPYTDSIPCACGGFASHPPYPSLTVDFTEQSRQACMELEKTYPGLTKLIEQVLQTDPRPAYMGRGSKRTEFGMRLYDLNIRWSVCQQTIVVQNIEADPTDTNAIEGNLEPLSKQ